LQQGNRGDHFGTNNLLPPDDKQTVISDTVVSADISQRFRVAENFRGDWSLSLLRNSTEQNQLFLGSAGNYGGFGSEDDIVADGLLEEQRIEGRIRLQYALEQHELMAEILLANLEVTSSERSINLDPSTELPSDSMNEFPVLVDESERRRLSSLVLQDEFHIGDRSTLTTGLRYDDYEDIGSNLSPRISLVWRQSDRQIFKAQLARAFRPPSLIESNGSVKSSIDPETNDTIEFGHIYNNAGLVLRNTLYYSRLENLILFQDSPPYGYVNGDSYSIRGYEFEIEKVIARHWQLVGSLSLQDYVGEALPGAAPWMVKLGAGYELRALTTLHLQLSSIARRERSDGDPRDDFEQTSRLDLSLQSRNVGEVGGLDLRLGVYNLLDQELKHPAPADTYPDDYPYSAGATLWLQLSYQP
jgi:iron complex outermembrane receptor protein